MKKKILALLMAGMLCLSMTACSLNRDEYVSLDKYLELTANEKMWEMTPDQMADFLNVDYIVDERSTNDWGDGYLVVDFPGEDSITGIHVIFSNLNETGKMAPLSLNPTGNFIGK